KHLAVFPLWATLASHGKSATLNFPAKRIRLATACTVAARRIDLDTGDKHRAPDHGADQRVSNHLMFLTSSSYRLSTARPSQPSWEAPAPNIITSLMAPSRHSSAFTLAIGPGIS